ncbi:MAG: hypothetical protein LQ350_007048 [Teloschistes chrysophthalmus]|nr:MAG: hypothetical protein LQ350_007048 [Niorma chrysophthalma]
MSQGRVFERASASSIRHALRPFSRNAVQRRFVSDEFPKLTGAADNAFNRERMAVKKHAGESAELWRRLSIYVAIPALILASINGKILWDEHWEHWATLPPLEERVEYDYQNIRTKKFPWGDGDKFAARRPTSDFRRAGLA